MTGNENPYLPELATVTKVIEETPNIKSFQVVFNDRGEDEELHVRAGSGRAALRFRCRRIHLRYQFPADAHGIPPVQRHEGGEVTTALHGIYEGDVIGVRAPLGNWFPYNDMKGKNILFIGGGIGLAPLRTLILYMLDNRADYKDITIIYGSRTPLICATRTN
jgi:NAD(P)H-flavin reductase